jgi:hypothetical protein
MATLDELHRFLLQVCKGEQQENLYFVKVRCPEDRLQTACVYVLESGEIVIESPFTKIGRVEHILKKLLSAVGEMTHYGIRQEDEFLALTTVAVLEEVTLRGLDYLISNIAETADEIEEIITDGEDSF